MMSADVPSEKLNFLPSNRHFYLAVWLYLYGIYFLPAYLGFYNM